MIAGAEALMDGAFDGSKGAVDQRHIEFARVPAEAIEAVLAAAREALGNGLLIFRQNTDTEMPGGAEAIDDGDGVAEADEHQRRIERKRGEGAHRKAVRSARGIGYRGDGDAGGEAPAGVPEQLARRRCLPESGRGRLTCSKFNLIMWLTDAR